MTWTILFETKVIKMSWRDPLGITQLIPADENYIKLIYKYLIYVLKKIMFSMTIYHATYISFAEDCGRLTFDRSRIFFSAFNSLKTWNDRYIIADYVEKCSKNDKRTFRHGICSSFPLFTLKARLSKKSKKLSAVTKCDTAITCSFPRSLLFMN